MSHETPETCVALSVSPSTRLFDASSVTRDPSFNETSQHSSFDSGSASNSGLNPMSRTSAIGSVISLPIRLSVTVPSRQRVTSPESTSPLNNLSSSRASLRSSNHAMIASRRSRACGNDSDTPRTDSKGKANSCQSPDGLHDALSCSSATLISFTTSRSPFANQIAEPRSSWGTFSTCPNRSSTISDHLRSTGGSPMRTASCEIIRNGPVDSRPSASSSVARMSSPAIEPRVAATIQQRTATTRGTET